MHKWQKDLWAGLTGSDPREMKIIMGGRNIGRSVMAQMWNEQLAKPAFSVVSRATVDNDTWVTVKCTEEVSKWIREQAVGMWYEHINQNWIVHKNIFDIHEKIHTMLQLKYGDA